MSAAVFAARLRELRLEKGWTQGELADRSGVSERAVAQWEQSIRQPSWENVVALADALEVSTEAFRQEPARPPEKRKAGRPRKAPPAEVAPPEEQPEGKRRKK
jgi:transcriptional regulator with XRE-family HTH domain